MKEQADRTGRDLRTHDLVWGPAGGHKLTTTHTQKRNTEFDEKLAKEALGELRRMQRVAHLKRSGTDAQPKQTLHFRGKSYEEGR